jgi:hypothetical protein
MRRIPAHGTAGAATLLLAAVLGGCGQSGSLRLVRAVARVHVAGRTPSAWSTPELIPAREIGTPTPEHPPVFDAKGDAVVVWTEARFSIKEAITLEYLVRTAVRPVDGQWQPAETLSHLGLDPAVAVDAHGDTIAVWQSEVSSIQAAIRPAGGSWLAPQTVAIPGGGDPQIASDTSGDVMIVAPRQGPGRSTGIQAVLRPSGGSFLPAQRISTPGNDFHPQIVMNARGDVLVAWERDARGCLVEAAFRPANGRWSRPRALSDAHAGCPADQQVAIDGRGDAILAWPAYRGRKQFVESASRSANGHWTARRVLARAPLIDGTVDVGMDARGDAMVVWDEEALKGGGSAIWTRNRPAGLGWGTAQTIPGAHGGPASLAIDARGDALVTWQDKRGIEAAARPTGGSWQTPYTVSAHEHAGPGVEGDGLAALDARGDALATWQNHEGIRTAWRSSLFP